MRIGFLLICILLLLSACEKESIPADVRAAVEKELVVFDADTAPGILMNTLAGNELVLFGETHYVQEHQEFLVRMLPTLSDLGYRLIFDELFHCFTWLVEDYVNGDIDTLPEFILFFQAELIEGVRQFNSTVDDVDAIQLVYMDVNHWKSNFLAAVNAIESRIGIQPLFEDLKAQQVDSEEYLAALQGIKASLESDPQTFIDEWGFQWFERIVDVVAVEIESSIFRTGRDDQHREQVIYQNIRKTLDANSGTKAIVNTGLYHAQKKTFMGADVPRIGQLLHAEYPMTYTIAFVGMKGEIRKHFSDVGTTNIDLPGNADAANVIRLINDLAANRMSMLPLDDVAFRTKNVLVSYDYGTTISAPIGEQFDAIFTYPNISTLKSMDLYDYN